MDKLQSIGKQPAVLIPAQNQKQIIRCAAADLYAIINLHWDGGWLEQLPEDPDACIEKYTAIWTQVSAAFRG